jgi:hypothetical protein
MGSREEEEDPVVAGRWHRGAGSCLKFVSAAIVISDKPCWPAAKRGLEEGAG